MRLFIYCSADGSADFARCVGVFLEFSEELRARLLRLRNVWATLKQLEHVDQLYSFEVFDRTITPVYKHFHEDLFVEDSNETEWVDGPEGFEPDDNLVPEHPRCDAMTLLVLEDGVKWAWFDHYSDQLYQTPILKWARVEQGHAVERCEKCGTPFSPESIDGGRCLGSDTEGRFCGTMVVGVPVEVKE